MSPQLTTALPRPPRLTEDDLLNGLTWGDLEQALIGLASPERKAEVPAIITALWTHSQTHGERSALAQVLRTAGWLASSASTAGSWAPPASLN